MTDVVTPLVIRPRKVRRIAIPVAVVILIAFVVAAVLLRSGSTGVEFGSADQFSIAAVGVFLSACAMLFTRPKVVADAEGVQVRSVLFGQKVPWQQIRAVSFPDGAPWARLELPADEYVPVLAIQAADGADAVAAIRELRARHRAAVGVVQDSDA